MSETIDRPAQPRVQEADRSAERSTGDSRAGSGADSRESKSERLEREHEQLFHEMRSIIPGVQVLFAFLLTIAFTNQFAQLDDLQRDVYYVTFIMSALTLTLLLAPSAFHRVRFRQHDKEVMLRRANVEVIVALVLISFSVAGIVFLISDLMFSTEAAVVASVLVWLATSALWWGYPLSRNRRDR